jgi:DDE superfamily endonuclease
MSASYSSSASIKQTCRACWRHSASQHHHHLVERPTLARDGSAMYPAAKTCLSKPPHRSRPNISAFGVNAVTHKQLHGSLAAPEIQAIAVLGWRAHRHQCDAGVCSSGASQRRAAAILYRVYRWHGAPAVPPPSQHQRLFYNGHKRQHAIKFQSVMAPDGLLIHLSGPFSGRQHDSRKCYTATLSRRRCLRLHLW